MRRGRLTVPPAPGTRPRPISGSAICVSVRRHHGVGEGGELDAGPHAALRGCRPRSACRVGQQRAPTLRSSRTRCAVAGSDLVPNSSRSPPAQNARPSPRSSTLVMSRRRRPRVSASTSSSRIRASSALSRSRSGQGDRQRVPVTIQPHAGAVVPLVAGRVCGPPRGELGPRLEHRIRGGLGHQPIVDGQATLPAQQEGQRRGGDRGARARFSSMRSRAGSPSSTIDVAELRATVVDSTPLGRRRRRRRAGWRMRPRSSPGGAAAALVQGDHHGAAALGGDVALQLGEQCFGAERFEDRETLPCRQWTDPGCSAGPAAAPWRSPGSPTSRSGRRPDSSRGSTGWRAPFPGWTRWRSWASARR